MANVALYAATKTLDLAIRADNTTSSAPSASTSASSSTDSSPAYKAAGISLAVASGLFIGTSFVLKKTGLLKANQKYHEEAGEGYGYLKNAYWWSGMTLMILGELCNFVAYAFVDAILVTPMGALSVVVTAILSAIFLKERLSFVGKAACFLCIVGSIIIPLNAPSTAAVSDIQQMQHYVIAPGFLTYAGVIIVGCLFTALWAGPRYGKKSMLVYLTVCSLIGGLSVVATQGLGSAILAQTRGEEQFNQWFLYVLFVFVVCTLLTEIIYLNKALNIFNAAMVAPTYYVYFTTATIVTSAVLFQGFAGSVVQIITMILGFLVICTGVVLLQMSKSAKDVPDATVFQGDLDQVRTIAEQEQPESEPNADTFRGTAGLLRAVSKSRRRREAEEARRITEDKLKDQLEPIGEDETVEWDGLRRRKTTIGPGRTSTVRRQATVHYPLGMSRFPDEDDDTHRPGSSSAGGAFGFGFRRKSRRTAGHGMAEELGEGSGLQSPSVQSPREAMPQRDGSVQMGHVYGLPEELKQHEHVEEFDGATSSRSRRPIQWADEVQEHPPQHGASPGLAPLSPGSSKRTFSFQNVFHKRGPSDASDRPQSRKSFASAQLKRPDETEEERLGLVKGDSHLQMPEHGDLSDSSEISGDERPAIPHMAYTDYDTTQQGPQQPRPAQYTLQQGSAHPLPSTPQADDDDDEDFLEAQRRYPQQGRPGNGRHAQRD